MPHDSEEMIETEKVKGQLDWKGSKENINREGGPPKELTYAELVRQAGEAQSKYDNLKTRKTLAVDKQWDRAEHGDLQSLEWLANREEGKPMQRSESDITSKGEKITGVVIEYVHGKSEGPGS